jgi:hypothetical protein
MKKKNTIRLYGLTRDWHFVYLCFGNKCFLFKLKFGRKDKKFHMYFGRMTSDYVMHTVVHNHNILKFVGIMIVPQSEMYNLFDK